MLKISILNPDDLKKAKQISKILTEVTSDFCASKGGHVPDDIVRDVIHKKYTSLNSIQKTFRETGYRFMLMDGDIIVGTVLIAKKPHTILVVDSENLNVNRDEFLNVCPPGYHHVFNLAIKKTYQRRGYGTLILKEIFKKFLHLFEGKGIWLRSDPPLHDIYIKMGFSHKTEWDKFLPINADIPEGFNSVREFNDKFLCSCQRDKQQELLAQDHRYKYSVFTYDFNK